MGVVANMAVAEQREDLLVLQSRGLSRLVLGLGFLLFGGLCFMAGLGVGHPNFTGPIARTLFQLLGIALGLIGLHNLFNNRSIRVDGARQQVLIHGRLLGLWTREQGIPFRQIQGIQVIRSSSSPGTRYWQIFLAQGSLMIGIDQSSNTNYINNLIEALQKVIGCSVAGKDVADYLPYVHE